MLTGFGPRFQPEILSNMKRELTTTVWATDLLIGLFTRAAQNLTSRSVNFIMKRNVGLAVNTDRRICLYPYRKELEPQYVDIGDMLGSCYVLCSFKRQEKMLRGERAGYFGRYEI